MGGDGRHLQSCVRRRDRRSRREVEDEGGLGWTIGKGVHQWTIKSCALDDLMRDAPLIKRCVIDRPSNL